MRGAAVLALIASAALAAPAAADQPQPGTLVARARRAMGQLEYDRAIQLLERAEASGRNPRDQLVVIYRSLAESSAALGQTDRAELHFRRVLALEPGAELPAGSSPKLIAPFDAARDFMRLRRPLAVRCEKRGAAVVLAVLSDPVDLVAGGQLAGADGDPLDGAEPASGRGRIALAVPAGAPADLACMAVDRHGNELVRAPVLSATATGSSEDDPSGVLPPGDVSSDQPRRRRRSSAGLDLDERDGPAEPAPALYARWWLWGAGALAATGTAIYFGIQMQNDEGEWRDLKRASEEHMFTEALAVQERGERHALYGNVAIGVSAGLGAVSAILLVRDLVRRSSRERSAAIGAAPLAGGGAAATLRLSF